MDLSKPWHDYTFVAFDTETSGKFPLVAEVVEVAAVKWKDGKIIDTMQSLVKPNRPMGDAVIAIHHITNEMVAGAPVMKQVLPDFDNFIKDSVLMAHNAAYDLGFMALEYEAHNIPLPDNVVLDSSLLSQRIYPKSINHRLATLVSMLGIHVGQSHRALDDSRACLEVSLKCLEGIGQDATLEHVLKVQIGEFKWSRFSMADLLRDERTRALVEGARKQLVLEITYRGGSQSGQPRRITPQGLVRAVDGEYVVGFCHRENVEKRFYINRILSAKILD